MVSMSLGWMKDVRCSLIDAKLTEDKITSIYLYKTSGYEFSVTFDDWCNTLKTAIQGNKKI
jgi:hypothetical protein